ncbi:MAG: helix-turn-helix domain-containing protein [Roseovarius sp.]
MPNARPTVIGVVLIPEFSQLVLTLLTELLRISQLKKPNMFRTLLCSADGRPVIASNQKEQPVDAALQQARQVDVAVVCASYRPFSHLDPKVLSWLRAQERHGARLCGVDTGTIALAEAGLLRGRRATLHWDDLQLARSRYPDTEFTSALVERDGRFITSPGSLGTTDFALDLIATIAGRDMADNVLDLAIHDRNQVQGKFADPVVAKAVEGMTANIEFPLTLPQVASHAGVSVRHLSRLFQAETGQSPAACYLGIRLDHASDLVRKSRFPLSEIAFACGFQSLSWFSRSFKARFGISPRAARQSASGAASNRSSPGHAD